MNLPFVPALIQLHLRLPQAPHLATLNASSRITQSLQVAIAVLCPRQTCLAMPTYAGYSLPIRRVFCPNAPQRLVSVTLISLTRTLSAFILTASANSQVTRQRHSCPPTGRLMMCPLLNNRRTQLSLSTNIPSASTQTTDITLSNTQPTHGGPLEDQGSTQILRRFPAPFISFTLYSCTARSSSGSSTCLFCNWLLSVFTPKSGAGVTLAKKHSAHH